MLGVRFLINEANKVEGLAYAGFETFRGSPYTSCARETGQNSRDAMWGTGPVRVEFKLLHIERTDVPFANDLANHVQYCLQAPQNEKTKAFLERAYQEITAPRIKILRISDYNTTGLTGPVDDPKSVFAALVKGDGITNKADTTSAGSFGIGKNAAFAVSQLQTVIYSTCYLETNGQTRFAAQGRVRLISHVDHVDGSKKYSAEGYWGQPDFRPIENVNDVPSWLARTEIGTSIHSVCFDERDHWDGRMTLSLVCNFFAAIDRGEIEFVVENTLINATTLDTVLQSEPLAALASDHDQIDELERARRLLLCTRSEAATRSIITIPGLGDFKLHLLVDEGLPREVHVLRNGIYITDNFSKFSQPMRQFPGTREFTAVLEPASGEAGRGPSALLKVMENPSHDAFEPDRIIDENDQKLARAYIKKLIAEVRRIIRSVAKIDEVESSSLDELSKMFADVGATRDRGRETDEEDPDVYVYQKPRPGTRRRTSGAKGKGPGRRRGGETEPRQPGARTGTGGTSRRNLGSADAVPLESIRSAVNAGNPSVRALWFTSTTGGEITLAISASGLTDDVGLDVVGASAGIVSNGRIRMKVRAGQRAHIDVTLSEPFAGPIELSAAKYVATRGAENENL